MAADVEMGVLCFEILEEDLDGMVEGWLSGIKVEEVRMEVRSEVVSFE